MKPAKYKLKFWAVALLFVSAQMFGCAAALVPVGAVALSAGVGAAFAGIVVALNMAAQQYPNIDFNEVAPVEVVYRNRSDEVWRTVKNTLAVDLKEKLAVSEKNRGVIRTAKRNLNDVSWIESALGKATFLYQYDITVKKTTNGTEVKAYVPFWEQKMFGYEREKPIPEGSNMMRHILFSKLSEKLTPRYVLKPPSHDSDLRTSRMIKVEWTDYKTVYQQDRQSRPAEKPSSPEGQKADATIQRVQEKLRALGYDPGPLDGLAGPRTTSAILQYQRDRDIPATGKADANTLVALGLKEGTVRHPASKSPDKTDTVSSAVNTTRVLSPAELKREKSLFSDTLTVIPEGGTVSITDVEGEWCRVVYKDQTGYIHSSFLAEGPPSPASVSAVKKKSREKPGRANQAGAGQKSATSPEQTAPASPPQEAPGLGGGKIGETTFLLSEPSFMADRLLELHAGQTVELLEETAEFYKATAGGKTGYIYKDFVNRE